MMIVNEGQLLTQSGFKAATIRSASSRKSLFGSTRLRINQDARVEHAQWIQFALGCPQCGSEKLRPLSVVPGSVIATDGMMMRDGAACRDQRVACRILDGLPLLEKRAVSTAGVEREIRSGPSG